MMCFYLKNEVQFMDNRCDVIVYLITDDPILTLHVQRQGQL